MSRLSAIPLLAQSKDTVPVSAPSPRRVFTPDQAPSPRNAAAGIDWTLIVSLRKEASAEIAANLAAHHSSTGRQMSELDRRLMGRSVAHAIVRAHARKQGDTGQELWSLDTEQSYAQALENAIFGYGRLQPLFEIADAENIEINGSGSVMIQFPDGTRASHPPVADSDDELIEAVRFLGESAMPSRPFDEAHPTMTLALGDRFRLHAIAFGLTHRPAVTIRQHTMTQVTVSELVDKGMLPMQLGRLLIAAVRARASIVISGDQGAGNTTWHL